MIRSTLTLSVALVAACCVSSTSSAQTVAKPEVQALQQAVPGLSQDAPRLGFLGNFIFGRLEISQVFYNTPASRLGLERGDRVLSVNGVSIQSVFDLKRTLTDAAYYRNGRVTVLVDNVRARRGEFGAKRFIYRTTYLDGFSQPIGIPKYPPIPLMSGNQR